MRSKARDRSAQFVAARGIDARRKIAVAEALHGFLQFAHRAREIEGQPIAERQRNAEPENMIGREEPRRYGPARRDGE